MFKTGFKDQNGIVIFAEVPIKKVDNSRAWAGLCLIVAVPSGLLGLYFLLIAVQSFIEFKAGGASGDPFGVGLGLILSICFLAVAVPLGLLGRRFLRATSADRSREENP